MDEYIDSLLGAAAAGPAGARPEPCPELAVRAERCAPPPWEPAPEPAPPADDAELLCAARSDDFSFAGLCLPAKVVDLYDGDTVRVAFRYAGRLIQWRARMAGYDSPEMKPLKSNPNRVPEKAAACAAREALAGKVTPGLVLAEFGPFDKYGRVLVTVYLRGPGGARGENVNAWMVAQGHGVPYGGGTKTAFVPPGGV